MQCWSTNIYYFVTYPTDIFAFAATGSVKERYIVLPDHVTDIPLVPVCPLTDDIPA